jgi:WD40 repeat protein
VAYFKSYSTPNPYCQLSRKIAPKVKILPFMTKIGLVMRNFFKSGFWLVISTVLSVVPLKAEAALLAASRASNSILRYDEQTGAFVDAFVPAGSGGLDGPSSLALGPDNNLYVTSYYNSSVLRYDGQTGAFIDVFIPSGSGGLSSPESIAFGPDNNIYISGLDDNGIRRYDVGTGAFIDTVVGFDPNGGDELNSPNFAFGQDNGIYISSVLPSNGVLRYDAATGETVTFIPQENAPEVPGGLILGPDNNLYVGDFSPVGSIQRYDSQTGAFIDVFVPPGTGGLNRASRLTFGLDRNLYVTSFGSDSILRFNSSTGALIDAFVPAGSGGLDEPIGLLFTSNHTPASVPEPASVLDIFGISVYLGASLLQKSKQKKQRW